MEGFKAFENWIESVSPIVERRHGYPPRLVNICFDREGSLTTTFGNMKSEADQYFYEKRYNRFFTSRGKSNGTEKIERYFVSLKRGTRTLLL